MTSHRSLSLRKTGVFLSLIVVGMLLLCISLKVPLLGPKKMRCRAYRQGDPHPSSINQSINQVSFKTDKFKSNPSKPNQIKKSSQSIKSISQSTHHPNNQPMNQPVNHSFNQPIYQAINQPNNQTKSINRSNDQLINQTINQSANQSVNRAISQSINQPSQTVIQSINQTTNQ